MKLSDVHACIFDMDGVIVDSAKYHFISWNRIADELGIPFDESANESLKGLSRVKSLDAILAIGNKSISQAEKDDLMNRKNEWYIDLISGMGHEEILPGVVQFLDSLKESKIKIALGSASKNAPFILKVLELEDYFEIVVDGNMVSRSKPDPEVFLKGAEGLNVNPRNTVVFEDSVAGVSAANNGGFYSVGIGDPDILSHAKIVMKGFEGFKLSSVFTS